jgi:hypothetical protein
MNSPKHINTTLAMEKRDPMSTWHTPVETHPSARAKLQRSPSLRIVLQKKKIEEQRVRDRSASCPDLGDRPLAFTAPVPNSIPLD